MIRNVNDGKLLEICFFLSVFVFLLLYKMFKVSVIVEEKSFYDLSYVNIIKKEKCNDLNKMIL